MHKSLALFSALLSGWLTAAPEYVEIDKPFSTSYAFKTQVQPVNTGRGRLEVPIITWAADGITIDANNGMKPDPNSRLAKAVGMPLEIKVNDDFESQIENYISGRSPFLRGTVGMITQATEGLQALSSDLEPVVILQLSWSTGADGFVAKDIKTLSELKGKSIVVQKNGPHLDLVQVLLQDAGLKPEDVTLKFVKDITMIDENKISDPASAFREDSSITGAACIYPDILTLTAGGNVGTGAEDSVKGARPILSTRTASRVVADVYAVRKDFFQSNREMVHGFVSELLATQASFMSELDAVKNKKSASAEFKKRCAPLAQFALQDSGAVNDFILWLGVDSELAGLAGNRSFFADTKNPVGFAPTAQRTATYFQSIGNLTTAVIPSVANWDYNSDFSTKGTVIPVKKAKPAFATPAAVRNAASKQDASELFRYTFQFPANAAEIKWQDYRSTFDTLYDTVYRYGGAVVQLRGHSDNFFYNFALMKHQQGATTYKQRKPGTNEFIEKPLPKLEQLRGSSKRLSYDRAFSVKRAYASYLREAIGLTAAEIDLSRFDVKGMGITDPVHAKPTSPAQRAENMRGEMVIFAVESEISLDFGMDDLQ